MAEIGFYHLQRSPIEEVLPRLLEKALAAGHRVLVRAPEAGTVERLVQALWTYEPNSFLPHGSARDGHAAVQPIYLTEKDENPNGADLLALTGGVEASGLDAYVRVLDLFDGNDEAAVAAARARWRRYLAEGHKPVYWQQKSNGGWERKS